MKNKPGFSLIEIILVILLMGIISGIAVVNLKPQDAKRERELFIAKLNTLTRFAWRSAVSTGTLHRVYFDFRTKKVRVQRLATVKTKGGEHTEQKFIPARATSASAPVAIPPQLKFNNFIIEGVDEAANNKTLNEVWFFVVPDGFTQSVIINGTDAKDYGGRGKRDGRPQQFGLVLNPFTAQFASYDTFQK